MSVELDLGFTGVEKVVDKMTRISAELKPSIHLVMGSNVWKMYVMARDLVHVRTGFLQQSIYWDSTDLMCFVLRAAAPYAKYVEYGTSRMAARPFLRPAVASVEPEMIRNVCLKIRELLEGS